MLAPDDGSDTFLLLNVVPHDEAYTWAAKHLYPVNTATRALEVRKEVYRDIVAEHRQTHTPDDPDPRPVYVTHHSAHGPRVSYRYPVGRLDHFALL